MPEAYRDQPDYDNHPEVREMLLTLPLALALTLPLALALTLTLPRINPDPSS